MTHILYENCESLEKGAGKSAQLMRMKTDSIFMEKIAMGLNLENRNDVVSSLPKESIRNFSTVLVLYSKVTTNELDILKIQKRSFNDKTDGANHAEQIAWREANKKLKEPFTLIKIAIASDLSPCESKSYVNPCTPYFTKFGGPTNENVLQFQNDRDELPYHHQGNISDVVKYVKELNKENESKLKALLSVIEQEEKKPSLPIPENQSLTSKKWSEVVGTKPP